MPIRFRCAYCNQLMGIARRKAGTVVRCPKCAGEIIVPIPDGPAGPEDAVEPTVGGSPFDVEKFDPALPEPAHDIAVTSQAPDPEPTETAPPSAPAPAPQRPGVFVPLGMLIISIGVVVLLLILMLVIGLIIGKATMMPADSKSAAISLARCASA